eukprot:jgi/Chlat1/5965/Chrsp4S00484
MVGVGVGARGAGASAGEAAFVRGGIAANLRADGRGNHDYREFALELGLISQASNRSLHATELSKMQASGSARLRLGGTDVITAVKAELGTPTEDSLDAGRLQFAVELAPKLYLMVVSRNCLQGRGGDELAAGLVSALERVYFAGKNGAGAAVDLSTLGVISGRSCWILYVDAIILHADGNLLDALSICAKAALSDTRIPKVEVTAAEDGGEGELEVGKYTIVDATEDEISSAHAAMAIAVDASGEVRAMIKQGGSGVSAAAIQDMLAVAKTIGKELVRAVDQYLSSQAPSV